MWRPPLDSSLTQIERWRAWLNDTRGLSFRSYEDLWKWSVDDLSGFWSSIWEYFGVGQGAPTGDVLVGEGVEGVSWFPEVKLNYAEELLARAPQDLAVIAESSLRGRSEMTGLELRSAVEGVAAGLSSLGVSRGDRVAAYLPNIPETLVLMLATASLGGIFTSCAPEFGVRAVLDRLRQVEPKVLVAIDGYRHRDRDIDRTSHVAEIQAGLPSMKTTVLFKYLRPEAPLPEGMTEWRDLGSSRGRPLRFEPLPFDHPLYILYSSGTTGLPKPIIHRHGGVLLEHLKLHHLHHDLGPSDRFFWFTTTGWVMWNYLVSGLLTGARILMFDGDPSYPSLSVLWTLAEREALTVFGASAPYYLACRTAEQDPTAGLDLRSIRQVGSTGAPLPPEGYYWLHDHVSPDACVVSASGGTDVCTAFVAGTPIHPVVAGEISCRCLGVRVESYDDTGTPVIDKDGELVVTAPMPSMPAGFWGDPGGKRYREAYFERFPGVWAHGDFIRITARGTCVISGRSDATLNRGGVRLGTSDFYSVLENLPGVVDSMVVHLEDPSGGPGKLMLFVHLSGDSALDEMMEDRIRILIREELSPRHVPDAILSVPEIPKTLTGKKLEIPVKRILLGASRHGVVSQDSLQSPGSLDFFEHLANSLGRERESTAQQRRPS